MKRIERPSTGNVIFIDKENNRVLKRVASTHSQNIEIAWLKKMKDFDRVPNLLSVSGNELELEYVGEELVFDNLPVDWKEQIEIILKGLEKYNCCHNDVRLSNMAVKDKKLYMIDFDKASSEPQGPYKDDRQRFYLFFEELSANG